MSGENEVLADFVVFEVLKVFVARLEFLFLSFSFL